MNSRLARSVLKVVYRDGKVYRIPAGPLAGTRLRFDPTINFHAMLGLWELENFRFLSAVFAACVRPDDTVFDVGANIGLYSLWAASRVPQGRVVAFEASPSTANTLRLHVTLNRKTNISVVEAAVAASAGTVTFYEGSHHHISSLDEQWARGDAARATAMTVRSTSLDEAMMAPGLTSPRFIKMDIEGGAAWALQGCRRIGSTIRPLIIIESHTPREDSAIGDFILGHDYDAFRLNTRRWVRNRQEPHPCPDGVWGTMLLVPSESRDMLASRRVVPRVDGILQ